jgi:hypothetical protein
MDKKPRIMMALIAMASISILLTFSCTVRRMTDEEAMKLYEEAERRESEHREAMKAYEESKRRYLKSSKVELECRLDSWVQIWNDSGSGASRDSSYWRTKGTDGGLSLGDHAAPQYGEPNFSACSWYTTSPTALAKPTDFKWIYNDSKTGAKLNGSFWRPICPKKYIAMGDVANSRYDKPSVNTTNFRCVHRKLLSEYSKKLSFVWKDQGSGGRYNVSVWGFKPFNVKKIMVEGKEIRFHPPTLFRAHNKYREIRSSQFRFKPNAVKFTPPYVEPLSKLASKFAPLLKFDRAARGYGYPMSAQVFHEKMIVPSKKPKLVENNDRASLANKTIPTYYQIRTFGNQVRINYWWFYGYQHQCTAGEGLHHGDWENIMVIVGENRKQIAAVVFFQHGGHYTRIAGPRAAPCTPAGIGRCHGRHGFETYNRTHPVVYVGKIAHGSYHDRKSTGVDGPGGCAYWADFRNPASSKDNMETWHKLVNLDQDPPSESWITKDKTAKWRWGPDSDSCGNHPTRNPPAGNMRACTGTPAFAVKDAGCYNSECLAGDDQAVERCIKECEKGYTNFGLTCNKGPLGLAGIYGRLNSGKWYRYQYSLPTSDIGLLRRRTRDSEWRLP